MGKRASRILVVDYEPANLQLMRKFCRTVTPRIFAKDGCKALELAERQRPDLILMDIEMPGMTGYETVTRLKRMECSKHIPALFVISM